jgi:hypothetical protein
MTMHTKKWLSGIWGFFVVIGVLLGFAMETHAETMKCKAVGVTLNMERVTVDDEEGHTLGLQTIEGLAIFDNGEVARTKIKAIVDLTKSSGFLAIAYFSFYFDDGATIVLKLDRRGIIDEKGVASTKVVSEIKKGTGRYAGIKGTATGPGKNFSVQGEAVKSFNDLTFTYTLPPR